MPGVLSQLPQGLKLHGDYALAYPNRKAGIRRTKVEKFSVVTM